MRERELKFIVPEDFAWTDVDLGEDLRLVQEEPLRYDTIYVDTSDLRLAGWGCSLRHRSGEGWTLKLVPTADGGLLERPELEFRDTSEVPVAALAIVAAYLRGSVVRPAVTPVLEPELRARVQEILDVELSDDVLAWELGPAGEWTKVPTVRGIEAHIRLEELALARAAGSQAPHAATSAPHA